MEPIRVYDNPPRDAWPALTARITRDDAEIDRRVAALLTEVRPRRDAALRRIAPWGRRRRPAACRRSGGAVAVLTSVRPLLFRYRPIVTRRCKRIKTERPDGGRGPVKNEADA